MVRIPIGDIFEAIVNWLSDNASVVFDFIAWVIDLIISGIGTVLEFPHPLVLTVIFALLAWKMAGRGVAIFTAVSFFLLYGMNLWPQMLDTLSMILASGIVALGIGIPLGILAAKNDTVNEIVRPILDFMQTMPPFVYLIPAVIFFGMGTVPGAIATVIFSMPPAIRLTNLGIRQVDKEVVEAGHAFGSTGKQMLFKIQLPLAMPTIMAGVNQTIMLSLSMVVIASMIGAGGLGGTVLRGITQLRIGLGFEGGLAVVIMAIFLDRITQSLQKQG